MSVTASTGDPQYCKVEQVATLHDYLARAQKCLAGCVTFANSISILLDSGLFNLFWDYSSSLRLYSVG
jgi:hypothetical protein